jgi:glyoxylase-like metal-dependent hydrolase (beta-lactamase superfamily II)
MLRKVFLLVACLSSAAFAQAPAEVTLSRIDCGTAAKPTNVSAFNPALQGSFTDTYAYRDLNLTFVFSCYLIKNGSNYMVWDTGFAPGANANAPKVGIADRLKEVGVSPEQVSFVGISHFHGDHTGQLNPFTNATLLIGKGDWDGLTSTPPARGANVAGFKAWIEEKRKVEPLTTDKDVFGDGSVIVLRTPGHTPGHSILMVTLKGMGTVLLSGDLVHFRENYESGGMPSFNHDRAATAASIERMKQIEKNLKATVIIQHDMRDVGKLPAWPNAAK